MIIETLKRHWWVPVIRGIAAIVFGVIAFTHPVMAAATLVLFFGAWVLVDGVFRVIGAIGHRASDPDWGFHLIIGILGIMIGFLTFHAPQDNGSGVGHLHCCVGADDWRNGDCSGSEAAPGNQGRMVPHPYGSGFTCLCVPAFVESGRRGGGSDLAYRMVRTEFGRVGYYFWLSVRNIPA